MQDLDHCKTKHRHKHHKRRHDKGKEKQASHLEVAIETPSSVLEAQPSLSSSSSSSPPPPPPPPPPLKGIAPPPPSESTLIGKTSFASKISELSNAAEMSELSSVSRGIAPSLYYEIEVTQRLSRKRSNDVDFPDEVRIVCIGDTHGDHWAMKPLIPSGDILIFAGDFDDVGVHDIGSKLADLNRFFSELPHKYKVYIPGNHEVGFATLSSEELKARLPACIYLNNSSVELYTLKIYGTPYSNCTRMAFGLHSQQLSETFSKIPMDADIVVTHMPPFNVLDLAWARTSGADAKICEACGNKHPRHRHWGSVALREQVERVMPAAHIFGHVHDTPGFRMARTATGTIAYVNCAVAMSRKPAVVTVRLAAPAPVTSKTRKRESPCVLL